MFLNASTLWHRLTFRLPFRPMTERKSHVRERFAYMAFYTFTESFFESTGEIASAFNALRLPLPGSLLVFFFVLQNFAFLQKPLKHVSRHRLRVVEALCIITAELNKHLSLFRVLHAFTDDLHTQFPGHVDNVADDNPFPRPEHPAPHEAAIEFEHVSHQLLQLAEGRIPRSEIVDGDHEAALFQPQHLRTDDLGIAHDRALGDFQFQKRMGYIVTIRDRRDKFGKFRAVEMQA